MPKQSEITTIALMGKDIDAIKVSQTAMALDIKAMQSSRYITQNELTLAVRDSQDQFNKAIGQLSNEIKGAKQVFGWFLAAIGLSVIGAVMKLILKI